MRDTFAQPHDDDVPNLDRDTPWEALPRIIDAFAQLGVDSARAQLEASPDPWFEQPRADAQGVGRD